VRAALVCASTARPAIVTAGYLLPPSAGYLPVLATSQCWLPPSAGYEPVQRSDQEIDLGAKADGESSRAHPIRGRLSNHGTVVAASRLDTIQSLAR
jgi:hypothetical protein